MTELKSHELIVPLIHRLVPYFLLIHRLSYTGFIQPAPEEKQTNVIYQINSADCSWKYIGERGRSLETRKKEHMRNVRKCKVGSNIAKHAWDNDHAIDFANCKVIDREIFVTEEHWNHGILLSPSLQITMPNIYLNNIDSYYNNCSHIFFY